MDDNLIREVDEYIVERLSGSTEATRTSAVLVGAFAQGMMQHLSPDDETELVSKVERFVERFLAEPYMSDRATHEHTRIALAALLYLLEKRKLVILDD